MTAFGFDVVRSALANLHESEITSRRESADTSAALGRTQSNSRGHVDTGGKSDVLYLDDVIREAANDPPLARSLLNIETKRVKGAGKFRH